MYKLRNEIIKKLQADRTTRNLLSNAIGISEQAVAHSINKKDGRSIAQSLNGMEFLKTTFNLPIEAIREPFKK